MAKRYGPTKRDQERIDQLKIWLATLRRQQVLARELCKQLDAEVAQTEDEIGNIVLKR